MNEMAAPEETPDKRAMREPERERLPLDEALRHRTLVIVGDPGSGKTTFLRHIAFGLCRAENPPFPLLIRAADLAQYIERHTAAHPERHAAPSWFVHFLANRSEAMDWGLDEDFFRRKMKDGPCLVLLDGLDEAPGRVTREATSRVIVQAARTYPDCKFVVTSRPGAYTGEVVLPGFHQARIAELEPEAIETFLGRWSEALYRESPKLAERHRTELLKEVNSPQIRRMARNPVMLTALAALHWNQKKLPEQRAELYESIIRWLARSREEKPDRVPADQSVRLHEALALA
ncbi:MAG: NACHT domain-containing protein, partial [bacterium]|nr:NACHT domain-containing protein [bacterium]